MGGCSHLRQSYDSWVRELVFHLEAPYGSRVLSCWLGTQGPSTPQSIAFAMICSGRDDRVGVGACGTSLVPFPRLALSAEGLYKFQSKVIPGPVAHHGLDSLCNGQLEFNLEKVSRFERHSGVEGHASFAQFCNPSGNQDCVGIVVNPYTILVPGVGFGESWGMKLNSKFGLISGTRSQQSPREND